MAGNPDVFALLEEMLNSGRSAEEVCRDCPELLPEVRRRWKAFRAVDSSFEAFFPDPGEHPSTLTIPEDSVALELPEIPGYRVEAMLGRGGMGVVFRAWHLRLNRAVALKMLPAGPCARAKDLERFLREAEAVAALQHPNIVQVHDAGEVEGRPFFTMELVEGGNLAEKIRGVPQPAHHAASVVATLADAVHAAHQHGVVHRDLKPGNILLTADGTPKVSDFGLAQRLQGEEGLTLTGVPMGTPSYMAPEQARGDKDGAGPATDIYALGAILYELLTGRPPFRAETATATLQQVLSDEPVPPARLNTRVPRDLQTICLKCLYKEPQRRYASAKDLADDLRRFERGEPITARPVGAIERGVRWVRRRPALAGSLAFGVLLASILMVTLFWWQGQRAALRATAVAYADADLREAERLRDRGELLASVAVLERARDRLSDYVTPEQRRQLRVEFDNLELVTQLDAVRMRRSVVRDKEYEQDTAQADRDYAEVFRTAGLGTDQDEAEVVSARVADSHVRQAILAALDDWAYCATDKRRRAWLLTVARLADPDSWRDRLRDPDPQAWINRELLAELARTAPLETESVQLLVALGSRLWDAGGREEAAAFFLRVQRAHPGDFYANNMLGNALYGLERFGDAVGYFRAALAVRPGSPIVWGNLGIALLQLERWDEARLVYEQCLRLDPENGFAHLGLGTALRHRGHADQAIEHLQCALPLMKLSSRLHSELAFAMQQQKRWGEAIDHFRKAASLSPDKPWLQYDLGMALNSPGHQDEAIEYLRKTLELDPRYPAARVNLARILFDRGRADEGIAELRRAIELDAKDTLPRVELRKALTRVGRWLEVKAAWRDELNLGPPNHDTWFGYAELCLFLGDEKEYRRARRDLLSRFGEVTAPVVAERAARACLLLPASDSELEDAAALADRAVAAGRVGQEYGYPYFLFVQGLARYRQARYDDAIKLMTGEAASVMGPCPRFILAMAQLRKGQVNEARQTLAAAIASYDWSESKANNHDAWIAHILRREAQALILPNPPNPPAHPNGEKLKQ